jgi:two-component system response regulator DegU
MTVLVVDNDARMRRTITNILGSQMITCIECDDGTKALDLYRKIQPAWVLMDVLMPGMNGFEATREIIETYPGARVAMVTDYDDVEFRDAARRSGASAYILKEELISLREKITQNFNQEEL